MRLPRVGLDELFRGWSGEGQLLDALAAVDDPDAEWTPRDIRRRADRVLLGKLEPAVSGLPSAADEWITHLPITSQATTVVSERMLAPVRWGQTARRFGWPSAQFVSSPRSRVRDEATLTTMAWCALRLNDLVRTVAPMAGALAARVTPFVDVLRSVAADYLEGVEPVRPGRLDLLALRSSGTPWTNLERVASVLVDAETDLAFLAYELIEPDPDLEWRLFHLSTFGVILQTLRGLGARTRWLRPLSAGSVGPQFRAQMPSDEVWDVWFEADSALPYYRQKSLYRQTTSAVSGRQSSIGADILVVQPGVAAMALECKWSASGQYVGRNGFHQAAAYALEARYAIAPQVLSVVVGPSEVIRTTSKAEMAGLGISMGATNLDLVATTLSDFLRD